MTLSQIALVRILWWWRGWGDEFQGGVRNYARNIVAALWDFEVLHSCLLAVPDRLQIGVDHGLERGPALEWGHDQHS